jgi:hypothetical protein
VEVNNVCRIGQILVVHTDNKCSLNIFRAKCGTEGEYSTTVCRIGHLFIVHNDIKCNIKIFNAARCHLDDWVRKTYQR